jgi:hypothetical protein
MNIYRTFMSSLVRAGGGRAGKRDLHCAVCCGAVVLLLFLGTMAYAVAAGTQHGEHVFYLQYKDNAVAIPLRITVDLQGREVTFKKEPDFKGRTVVRSALVIGGAKKVFIPFAWDKDASKLYVDLNRNMDLTDDSTGVFTGTGSWYYQNFLSIPLELSYDSSKIRYLIDLNFMQFGSEPNVYVSVRSLWEGEIELEEKKWDLAIVDDLDGSIDPLAQESSDRFVIRPWALHDAPIGLTGVTAWNNGALPIPANLFIDKQAYKVSYAFEPRGEQADLKVVFTETPSQLGELKISGTSVKRLILRGDCSVVLDSPESIVKVPLGKYATSYVLLQRENSPASAMAVFSEDVSITETAPAVLNIGGPLHNDVRVRRNGEELIFDYQLVDPSGKTYALANQDANNPPEFAIYKGDRKIYSGKFQYG